MNVFQKFRARQRDMKTLSALISASLERAQLEGVHAGAQHLVASAIDMPDGSAERAFARMGTTGAAFAEAVEAQRIQALEDLGIPADLAATAPPPDGVGTGKFGKADATYEAAIKEIHDIHNEQDDYRALVGAHVVAGVASVDRGVAARALRAMNIEREELIDACRAEAG